MSGVTDTPTNDEATPTPFRLSPVIQRPSYLSGATPSAETVTKVVRAVSPVGSLALGAVVGAVAAYFVPKVLDHFIAPQDDGNVNFEVEDRDD